MRFKLSKVAAASVFMFLYACTGKSQEKSESKGEGRDSSKEGGKAAKGGRGGNRPVPLVEVYELKDSSLPEILKIPVTLEGRKQIEVYARGSGRIQALNVVQGGAIDAGNVLFTLDRSEPGETYLPAPVLSPASGKVAQWFVVPGNQVTAQTAVALIVDDQFLRAKVPVALDDWQRVSSQTQVRILRDDKTWKGKIVSIPKAVANGVGRVEIEVEIPNIQGALRAGLSAEAEFTLPATQRLLLPSRALLLTSDGSFVFTVRDDTLKKVPVRMRPVSLDWAEIQEPNFAPGDRFVVSGFSRLSAGSKVRVAKPATEKAKSEGGEKQPEARGEKQPEARGEKQPEARGERRSEARGEKQAEARGEKAEVPK